MLTQVGHLAAAKYMVFKTWIPLYISAKYLNMVQILMNLEVRQVKTEVSQVTNVKSESDSVIPM